ncbi:MAG: glycosyltransferase [Saprospiraceae bacterium]|nr:glycosyltransferase [Saprospiraceae bacterium]
MLTIFNLITLAYSAWGALYQLLFSIAGIFYKPLKMVETKRLRRMAVLIPAYREDAVIVPTVTAALQQDYPQQQYQIVVIADQLQQDTVAQLRQMPIEVIEVAFEKSTKSKSLRQALDVLRGRGYEVAVILDADNGMKSDFLSRVNQSFSAGVRVLQGRRMAKNGQTNFALLDAASEDANNHILCKGHRALGLSARLAGSGMAFDYALFDQTMQHVEAIGGFDKELELRLTKVGETIEYDENTIVFDEKVSQSKQFSRQRSRWLAAQYQYAERFLPDAVVQFLLKGQLDFLNKSLQMTLPPRLVLPFALAFGALVNFVFATDFVLFWALALGFNLLSFALALPKYCFQIQNLKIWRDVPSALWATLKALTQMRVARRQFIHTAHHIA